MEYLKSVYDIPKQCYVMIEIFIFAAIFFTNKVFRVDKLLRSDEQIAFVTCRVLNNAKFKLFYRCKKKVFLV
jgi:hypothetical protein